MILSRDQRDRQRAYDGVVRKPLSDWCPACCGGKCNEDDTAPCETCNGVGRITETDAECSARVNEELEAIEYGPSHDELHGRI
jgi:hypothetical protein